MQLLPRVRVVEADHQAVGFCITRDTELYQLYVSRQSRGSGAAVALITDAERRLLADGVKTVWLACAIGNDRAAKFYERNAWQRVGTMINLAKTTDGTFPLEVWRYERLLREPLCPDLRVPQGRNVDVSTFGKPAATLTRPR